MFKHNLSTKIGPPIKRHRHKTYKCTIMLQFNYFKIEKLNIIMYSKLFFYVFLNYFDNNFKRNSAQNFNITCLYTFFYFNFFRFILV